MNLSRYFVRGVLPSIATCCVLLLTGPATAEEQPYTVKCEGGSCAVDASTYKGWRTYHAFCHTCHSQDAVGSTFAPSLLVRFQQESMTKEHFVDVVTNGFTGQVGVMPGWKGNPNVIPRIDDLWAYLNARSDGALEPGRPTKLKE